MNNCLRYVSDTVGTEHQRTSQAEHCIIDLGKWPMLAYICCELSVVTHCQHAKHFSCVSPYITHIKPLNRSWHCLKKNRKLIPHNWSM